MWCLPDVDYNSHKPQPTQPTMKDDGCCSPTTSGEHHVSDSSARESTVCWKDPVLPLSATKPFWVTFGQALFLKLLSRWDGLMSATPEILGWETK